MLTPLRAVAAHGVGRGGSIADRPLDPDGWRRLLADVRSQRLEGLLARTITDGALPVTEEQAVEAEERERAVAASALRLERALLETTRALRAAGILTLVLKGPAVAHLDYSDPALRQFGDIDVLLPSYCFADGLAVLLGAGCTRPVPELAPGFDRRFGKGVTLRRQDELEVDVHRTLVAGTFGLRIDGDSLFSAEQHFTLGGQALACLARHERFLHACYHAALGDAVPRLVPVRDVAEMLRHPDLDWAVVLRIARAWRGEAVVARAVLLCAELLEADLRDDFFSWAQTFQPSARDRRAIEGYLSVEGRFARQAIGAIREVRGLQAKAAYVRALTLPQGEHLAGRGRSRFSHLLRSSRRLGRRRGG